MIEAVSSWHEDTIGFGPLLLCSSKCSGGVGRFTLNGKIILSFGHLVDFDKLSGVLAWVWTFLGVKPWPLESVGVATKGTESDSLLLLLAPILFVPGSSLELQRTVDRVVDVDVGTRSGVWCLNPLVYWSLLSAVESCVNCFFLHNPILDIVFLFLVVVLTGTWILGKGLASVWSFSLMLPKLTSLCFGQEGLRLLPYELAIRCRSQMVVCGFFNRNNGLVSSWAWSTWLYLRVFAVRNFRLEDSVLTRWIELLLS